MYLTNCTKRYCCITYLPDYNGCCHWTFLGSLVPPLAGHRDASSLVPVQHCPEFHFALPRPLICLFFLLTKQSVPRFFAFEPVLTLAV